MLTTSHLNELLARVTYRPGWTFVAFDREYEGQYVLIFTCVPNAYQPDENVELRIFSPLPRFNTDEEFLRWLLWRVTRIEEHEALEFFRFDGKPYFDPHTEDDTPAMKTAVEEAKRQVGAER